MLPEKRTANTAPTDIAAFDKRRDVFLDAQLQFKTGRIEYGVIAINTMMQMYYILPAARHIINIEKAEGVASHDEFGEMVDAFRKDILKYARSKAQPQTTYLEYNDFIPLDNKLDAIVKEFYKILSATGFSP